MRTKTLETILNLHSEWGEKESKEVVVELLETISTCENTTLYMKPKGNQIHFEATIKNGEREDTIIFFIEGDITYKPYNKNKVDKYKVLEEN